MMGVSEIKEAIARLSSEERRELVQSLTRKSVDLTAEERSRIQAKADGTPEDQWIDWEDLKRESS